LLKVTILESSVARETISRSPLPMMLNDTFSHSASSSTATVFPNLASPAVDKRKGIHIVATQVELILNWHGRSGEKRSNYCHPYYQHPLSLLFQ
jgi:hypothetical protein